MNGDPLTDPLSEEPDSATINNPLEKKDVDRLREAVLENRPVLEQILGEYGQTSVFEYINSYTTAVTSSPVHAERKQELIKAFKAEVALRLGNEVAEAGAKQLEKYYYASTTDHYGPMYHPWVLNFNLVSAAAYLENSDPDLRNIITLACSNVSLNNFSFPRGLMFSSLLGNEVQLNRLSFLPSNAHSYPVFNFRPYSQQDIKKIKKLLHTTFEAGKMRKEVKEKIFELLDTIYNSPEALVCKNYADQVTQTNFHLWRRICRGDKRKEINFIYIEQERLVARLLIENHLDKTTSISRLLFDEAVAESFIRHFDDLPESFSTKNGTGTYLLWHLPENGKQRLKLWRKDGRLVSDDGSYSVALTPEAIRAGLESGELMPSVLFTFVLLFCHYGLKCLGGMGQINYLPKLKAAYIKMKEEEGDTESTRICEPLFASHLGGEVAVAFLGGEHGIFTPATSLDLLVYGDNLILECITHQAKKITLQESLNLTLPDDYPMHYLKVDRDPRLASIKPRDITRLTGLDKEIAPCALLA